MLTLRNIFFYARAKAMPLRRTQYMRTPRTNRKHRDGLGREEA